MGKKKTAGKPESDSGRKMSFERALEKLEQIVGQLEDGQLGLDESLSQYELGMKYLRQCYRRLEAAEQKIELLSGADSAGEARVEPFDETRMSLEEKQAARSRRRSQGPAGQAASGGRQRQDEGGEDPTMDDESTLF